MSALPSRLIPPLKAGKLIFHLVEALAEFERDLIREALMQFAEPGRSN